jgi:hypothetical protein
VLNFSFFLFEKIFPTEPGVTQNFGKQTWANILSGMYWNYRSAPIRMLKEEMTASLPVNMKSQFNQHRDDFSSLQSWESGHTAIL